jgi:glycosyltransferase involved in cell wall biosynthesis
VKIRMTGSEWFDSRQGGLNRYFEDLYRALQAHPDVEVEAAAFGAAPAGGESWGPVAASLPARLVRSFRHERRAKDADVLDTHFALYPLLTRRRPGQVRIVHFQGPWARESEQAGHSSRSVALKRRVERHVYRQADRVIVLSEAFRDIAVQEYGVSPDKVVVIPPGVDTTKFTPGPLRAPGGFRVVCVRRLEHRMGIHVLLEAWREVVRSVLTSKRIARWSRLLLSKASGWLPLSR